MKNDVNFFPHEPGRKINDGQKKITRRLSLGILIIFLIFNLLLFGFYFFLTKNTSDTLLLIDRQKEAIQNLSVTENLYLQLKQKLTFLTTIWAEPERIKTALNFVNGFLDSSAALRKMSFKQDGAVTLDLTSLNSSELELFLAKARQAEKDGKFKELRIDSANKNSEASSSAYEFILSFKLLELTK